MRLDIAPHIKIMTHTMLAAAVERRELNMAKRIHRFGHASASDMQNLMEGASFEPAKVTEACRTVLDACPICITTGRPANMKKISPTHMNESFNVELQVDFTYIRMRGERYEMLIMIDLGTKYGERECSRSPDQGTR